jgi:site-specific recombinase XerD
MTSETISLNDAIGDLSNLIGDFERSLAAANKSPRTIQIYGDSARRLVAFLRSQGMPTAAERIGREHLEAFTADQLARFKPATASQRYRALAQLWKWLAEEAEVRDNPFLRMKPPSVPEAPVPVLSDAALRQLLAQCEGPTFEHRRDAALVRLLIDCGVRCAELINLTPSDVDREQKVILVVGKGRRQRPVPYGMKAATAMDRYLRARARHSHAAEPWLWLGTKGRLTDSGLRQMLERRGEAAGIGHIYPHQFRHTMAHRWMNENGGEGNLMAIAGWRSRSMLNRYGASAASERARQAHHRLGLGDRL